MPAPTKIDNYGPTTTINTDAPTDVWLTAESLGENDPALLHNPSIPAVFVFDEPLLMRLRISPKRIVFLVETLAEIAETRPLNIFLGDPQVELDGKQLAVTHAPVPGFQKYAQSLNIVETWPWPWLSQPNNAPVHSFSSWVKKANKP